nr:MAG: putative capsid protein [Arizlama virus]
MVWQQKVLEIPGVLPAVQYAGYGAVRAAYWLKGEKFRGREENERLDSQLKVDNMGYLPYYKTTAGNFKYNYAPMHGTKRRHSVNYKTQTPYEPYKVRRYLAPDSQAERKDKIGKKGSAEGDTFTTPEYSHRTIFESHRRRLSKKSKRIKKKRVRFAKKIKKIVNRSFSPRIHTYSDSTHHGFDGDVCPANGKVYGLSSLELLPDDQMTYIFDNLKTQQLIDPSVSSDTTEARWYKPKMHGYLKYKIIITQTAAVITANTPLILETMYLTCKKKMPKTDPGHTYVSGFWLEPSEADIDMNYTVQISDTQLSLDSQLRDRDWTVNDRLNTFFKIDKIERTIVPAGVGNTQVLEGTYKIPDANMAAWQVGHKVASSELYRNIPGCPVICFRCYSADYAAGDGTKGKFTYRSQISWHTWIENLQKASDKRQQQQPAA